jgi:hypothetical protein
VNRLCNGASFAYDNRNKPRNTGPSRRAILRDRASPWRTAIAAEALAWFHGDALQFSQAKQRRRKSMSPLLLATVLAMGGDVPSADKADAPKLDGKWMIVYAEEGGRRNNAWENKAATIEGTNLTYKDGDKERSLKMTFGDHQTLKASFKGEGEKKGSSSGVYIAAQDYLCLSLNPEGDAKAEKGTSSGAFILILRRQK